MGIFGDLYRPALAKKAEMAAKQSAQIEQSLVDLSDAIASEKKAQKKAQRGQKNTTKLTPPKKDDIVNNPLSVGAINFDTYVFTGTPAERDKAKRQSENNQELAKQMAHSIEKIAENTKVITKQDTKAKIKAVMGGTSAMMSNLEWSFKGIKEKFGGFWKTIVDLTTSFAWLNIFKDLAVMGTKLGIAGAIGYNLAKWLGINNFKDLKTRLSQLFQVGKGWWTYLSTTSPVNIWNDLATKVEDVLKTTGILKAAMKVKGVSEDVVNALLDMIGSDYNFKFEDIGPWLKDWRENWKPKLEPILEFGVDAFKHLEVFVSGFAENWDSPIFWAKKIFLGLTVLSGRSVGVALQLAGLFTNAVVLPALSKLLSPKAFKWLMKSGTDKQKAEWDADEKKIRDSDPFSTAKTKMRSAYKAGVELWWEDFGNGFKWNKMTQRKRMELSNTFQKGVGVPWNKFKKMYKNNKKEIKQALEKMRQGLNAMPTGFTDGEIYLKVARKSASRSVAKGNKLIAGAAGGIALWDQMTQNTKAGKELRWEWMNDYRKMLADHYSGKKKLSKEELNRVTNNLSRISAEDDSKYKNYLKANPNKSPQLALLEYYAGIENYFGKSKIKQAVSNTVKATTDLKNTVVKAASDIIESTKMGWYGGPAPTGKGGESMSGGLAKIAYAVRVVESSNKYNIAKNHGDGGGLTVGAYQFTSNAGWVQKLTVIAKEMGVEGARAQLTQFRGKQPGSGYVSWFKKYGNTQAFQKAQDKAFELFFYKPGKKLAKKHGITDPVMVGHIIDHNHNTGSRAGAMLSSMTDKSIVGISVARKEDYAKIAEANTSKRKYLKGWYKRVDKFTKAMGSSVIVPSPSIGTSMLQNVGSSITAEVIKSVLGSSYTAIVDSIAAAFGISESFSKNQTNSFSGGVPKGSGESFEGQSSQDIGNCKIEGKSLNGLKSGVIKKLKTLCATTGSKIYINSAYRSPAYNAKIGGAKNSYHMKGMAVDVHWPGMSIASKIKFLKAVISAGFTGIGIYPNFVHMDIRANKASWGGSAYGGDVPAWAQPIISGASDTNFRISNSKITTPPGSMYIPQLGGLVSNGGQAMQIISENNKYINGELDSIRMSVDKLADKEHTAQDGDLVGIISIDKVVSQ